MKTFKRQGLRHRQQLDLPAFKRHAGNHHAHEPAESASDEFSCSCSVAAVALLPGNTGIWGAEPLLPGSASAEVINTASSRWVIYNNDMRHAGAYLGYKCEVGCLIPMWVLQSVGTSCEPQQTPAPGLHWGYAPQQPAQLPFLQGMQPATRA